MGLRFSWDPTKAASNARKHGVTFLEAATAFEDPLATMMRDPDRSIDEDRFLLQGVSYQGRLLVVAFAEEDDGIRLISARPATGRERRRHEEGHT